MKPAQVQLARDIGQECIADLELSFSKSSMDLLSALRQVQEMLEHQASELRARLGDKNNVRST